MAERGWLTGAELGALAAAHAAQPELLADSLLAQPTDALALLRDLHIRRRPRHCARGSTASVHFLLRCEPGRPALPLVLKLSRPNPDCARWVLAERLRLAHWQTLLGAAWPCRLAPAGPLLVHARPKPRLGFLMVDCAQCTLWDAAQNDVPDNQAALWLLQVLLIWAALLRAPVPAAVYDPALTNFGLCKGRVFGFDFGMLALGRFPPDDPATGCARRLGERLRNRPCHRAADSDHGVFHGFPPPPDRPPATTDELLAQPTLNRLALQLVAHLAAENHRAELPCAPLARLAERLLPWHHAEQLRAFANRGAPPDAYPTLYEAAFCRRVHDHPNPPWGDLSWRRLRNALLHLAGGAPAAERVLARDHGDLLRELPPLRELLTT